MTKKRIVKPRNPTGKTGSKEVLAARKLRGPKPNQREKAKKRASQDRFLEAYKKCGVLARAAESAGQCGKTHYNWMKDPDYQERFNAAQEEAIQLLEAEAIRRAVDGVEEPVFGSGGQGKGTIQVGTVKKYSDTLLIFMLKGARPEKYRDRMDHRHSGGFIQASVSMQEIMDELDRRDRD